MPRPTEAEIEESYERSGRGTPDAEDMALIRHVLCLDDEPPQGLHRGGWNPVDEEYDWS